MLQKTVHDPLSQKRRVCSLLAGDKSEVPAGNAWQPSFMRMAIVAKNLQVVQDSVFAAPKRHPFGTITSMTAVVKGSSKNRESDMNALEK